MAADHDLTVLFLFVFCYYELPQTETVQTRHQPLSYPLVLFFIVNSVISLLCCADSVSAVQCDRGGRCVSEHAGLRPQGREPQLLYRKEEETGTVGQCMCVWVC